LCSRHEQYAAAAGEYRPIGVRCGGVVSVATVGQANAVDAATSIARM